jgi:hypothetical protein
VCQGVGRNWDERALVTGNNERLVRSCDQNATCSRNRKFMKRRSKTAIWSGQQTLGYAGCAKCATLSPLHKLWPVHYDVDGRCIRRDSSSCDQKAFTRGIDGVPIACRETCSIGFDDVVYGE